LFEAFPDELGRGTGRERERGGGKEEREKKRKGEFSVILALWALSKMRRC